MMRISVDFDGVLHDYGSGWQGAHVVGDGPVPGALKFLREAVRIFEVYIYSSRSHQTDGIKAMREALLRWDQEVPGGPEDHGWFDKLIFATSKPSAKVSLDDRVICFTGTFPSMEELANFKTWQGK